MATDEQRRRNIRLGLILGSVALAFLIGYVIRMVLFGG
ncbi:cytochrome oxidase small assembly protein [Ottowia sp.]|nr:cytochrome oxidase small assembly protein [Ottowia sp.]HRN76804.1 cytochrome oxidase small assembly protein [Ottowia sp.]HRQ02639.1 cytochrome oxidase small assembly protein [Ottowia sp.]